MKQIIGKSDRVDFPAFGLENIQARIDTGAASSSIRASYIKENQTPEGTVLSFCLLGDRKHRHSTANYTLKKVKSSNGQVQERYVVKLDIVLFGKKHKTDFTLARRKEMKFPILLGRKLLRNRFIVDVSKQDLSFELKEYNKK
jgi:hypothetical protein